MSGAEQTVLDVVNSMPILTAKKRDATIEFLQHRLDVDLDAPADTEFIGLKEADFAQLFAEQQFRRREQGTVVQYIVNQQLRNLQQQVTNLSLQVQKVSIIQGIQATLQEDGLSHTSKKVKRDLKSVKSVRYSNRDF